MVDSYEIYGDNQNEDSEDENDEDVVAKRKPKPAKTNAANKGARQSRGRHNDNIDGIGEVMIDEHVIEPSKMTKNDNYRSASNNQGNRKAASHSRPKERENSGVKKTQIEVLDHETPIEEYKQYY